MSVKRDSVASAGKRFGGRVAAWLNVVLGPRARGSFPILLYHRVTAIPRGIEAPTMNVTPFRIRQQIEGMVRLGYTFWPLSKVIERSAAGERLPSKVGVLTFDDGFENVYLNVWPLLSRLHVPATLFVATAFIDSPHPFPFDGWGVKHQQEAPFDAWRPLSWVQCKEMDESGIVEIGTHSHTHRDFREEPEELERDLLVSLGMLRDRLRPGPRPFAFPFGSGRSSFDTAQLQEAARRAGVTCALTTEIGLANPRTHPFFWPRLEVIDADGLATLKAKLDGWYSWMGSGRRVFRHLAHAFRSGLT